MDDQFLGKVALITGGASGLGAAVAGRIASHGAAVAILDVNERDGQKTATDIGGVFYRFDVADPAGWPGVVSDIVGRLGPIDYAHLNAGIMTARTDQSLEAAKLANISADRYRKVMGVNVDGVFFGLQALLPVMIAGGGGGITVTSSMAGLAPFPPDPLYTATKHALVGLVRCLASAFADAPIRINALCPGGIDTQLIPAELRGASSDLMAPAELADEVADMLLRGRSGEIRLKVGGSIAARSIDPPDIWRG